MNERTAKLINIMTENNLSYSDVGTILGRTKKTVEIWCCSNKPGQRVIPGYLLELLEFKLAQGGDHE